MTDRIRLVYASRHDPTHGHEPSRPLDLDGIEQAAHATFWPHDWHAAPTPGEHGTYRIQASDGLGVAAETADAATASFLATTDPATTLRLVHAARTATTLWEGIGTLMERAAFEVQNCEAGALACAGTNDGYQQGRWEAEKFVWRGILRLLTELRESVRDATTGNGDATEDEPS